MASGRDRNTEGQDIGAPLCGVDSIGGVEEFDTGPPFRVAFTIQNCKPPGRTQNLASARGCVRTYRLN